MKKLVAFFILGFIFTAYGQYKDSGFPTHTVRDGILNPQSGNLFGFLGSENFSMQHSFGLQYSTFGSQSLALGMYTNSMMYKFSDKLNVQADVSIIQTPYSTLGKNFENNINGIYLSKAAVNYQPWKDVNITLQYRHLPYSYYNPYYGGYGFFGNNLFYNDEGFFTK